MIVWSITGEYGRLGSVHLDIAGGDAVVPLETYTQEGAVFNPGYDTGNYRTRQDYHGEFQPEST